MSTCKKCNNMGHIATTAGVYKCPECKEKKTTKTYLRRRYAGMAMQSFLQMYPQSQYEQIAEWSVLQADALIKALETDATKATKETKNE